MRAYETTFIINPQTDDTTIEKHVNDVLQIINQANGKVLHQENQGTRRLAYDINGLSQGYYASFIYEANQEVLPALDKHFKQNEMYLRNLTIRLEDHLEEVLKIRQGGAVNFMDRRRGHDDESKGKDSSDDKAKAKEEEKPEAAAAPAEEAKAEESKEEAPKEDSSDDSKAEKSE